MKQLIAFTLACLSILSGCDAGDHPGAPVTVSDPISVTEFSQRPEYYSNKRVRVQGFLNASGPGLYLSEDKNGAPNRDDPIVFIFDPKLHFTMGNEGYTVAGTKRKVECTGKFVEVVGETGQSPEFLVVSILNVESITIYVADDFESSGESCYP